MGANQSKSMVLGNLSEEDVEKIRKKFHFSKKESEEKISIVDFIYAYPFILRPHVSLILPSLHSLFKKNSKSEISNNNSGINYALHSFFNKSAKKIKSEITLQEIVTILSYMLSGKSQVIVKILFSSFLHYTESHHHKGQNSDFLRKLNDKKECVEKREDFAGHKESHTIEDLQKQDNELALLEQVELFSDEQEEETIKTNDKNNKSKDKGNKKKKKKKKEEIGVHSDSNINIMNKNNKKERNFTFTNDNVLLLDQLYNNLDVNKRINMKHLVIAEETLHHLFTFMYIEQMYLICPRNTLFHFINSKNANSSGKKEVLTKSKSSMHDDFLLNRRNSWDLSYFFKELFSSFQTDLDFRNIISGFRYYLSIKENSSISVYSLAVEYVNTIFINMGSCYAEATLKHFTDYENTVTEEKKDPEDLQKVHLNLNEICLNSIEMIHSIYTNLKKNEMKAQETNGLVSKVEEHLQRSSSILEIQSKTNGWRGIFLNKTSKILTDEIVFALHQCSKSFIDHEWYRLYASWKQGTSFNRFISSFMCYPSTIVVVIKTNDNQILGAVSTTSLKDSHLFQGSPSDFLFSASPIFRIIRTSKLGTNYAYLNSKNSFYPRGLGFGGKTECFRFFLSDEFKGSYCTQSDYTYEIGRLYFPSHKKRKSAVQKNKSKNRESLSTSGRENEDEKETQPIKGSLDIKEEEDAIYSDSDEEDSNSFLCKLSISEVEVWGCGDAKALEEQQEMMQNEENCKQERRSVDKSKIVQNSFDKEFLLPKVFVAGKMENLAPDT